jgi:hypothetical protein
MPNRQELSNLDDKTGKMVTLKDDDAVLSAIGMIKLSYKIPE